MKHSDWSFFFFYKNKPCKNNYLQFLSIPPLILSLSLSLSHLVTLFSSPLSMILPFPLHFQYNCSSQCARILCLAINNLAHIRLHHWSFFLWYSICTYGYGANVAAMQKKKMTSISMLFMSCLFFFFGQTVCCSVFVFIDVSVLFQPPTHSYLHGCFQNHRADGTHRCMHTQICPVTQRLTYTCKCI